MDKNWTDTTVVLKDEMLTKAITGRDFYIRGRLFLWSTHTVVENQKDSFMISYNPENLYTQEDGKRIYNLYLRAIAGSYTQLDVYKRQVSINSAALRNPSLIEEIAKNFGSQVCRCV